MAYWLFKSEPDCFSFADLLAAPGRTTGWDGVRNFQARNFLRDDIQVGDGVLFYHSNADPPAIAGIAEVVEAGIPTRPPSTPSADHHDPRAGPTPRPGSRSDPGRPADRPGPLRCPRSAGPALAGWNAPQGEPADTHNLNRSTLSLVSNHLSPREFRAILAPRPVATAIFPLSSHGLWPASWPRSCRRSVGLVLPDRTAWNRDLTRASRCPSLIDALQARRPSRRGPPEPSRLPRRRKRS